MHSSSHLPSFGAPPVRIGGSGRLVHGRNLTVGKAAKFEPQPSGEDAGVSRVGLPGSAAARAQRFDGSPRSGPAQPDQNFSRLGMLWVGVRCFQGFGLFTHSQDLPQSPAHADRAPRSFATIAQAQKQRGGGDVGQ